MAVTVASSATFSTLSAFLKLFALSPRTDDRSSLYKTHQKLMLLTIIVTHVAGMVFEVQRCKHKSEILHYIYFFVLQIRFIATLVDNVLPFVGKKTLEELSEVLKALKASRTKTVLIHVLLNYSMVIVHVTFVIISMCYQLDLCTPSCLIPQVVSFVLGNSGFFRSFCLLLLLKQRVQEVSQDLRSALRKNNKKINLKPVDEVLDAVHAFGRCFGIQLALQFMEFESVLVQDVVLLKKVDTVFPLSIYLLMAQRIFINAVSGRDRQCPVAKIVLVVALLSHDDSYVGTDSGGV